MRGILTGIVLFCLGLALPNTAIGQEQVPGESSVVFIVNPERVFSDSDLGARIRDELNELARQAAAENDRITAELVAEEQDLAKRRPDMNIDDFRAEADAFDQRVQQIRADRDAKEREIAQAGQTARANFNEQARDVIGQVLLSRGGVVVLDSRSVYLAVSAVDITQEVIGQMNAIERQGSNATQQ